MSDVYAENHQRDPVERWHSQPVFDTDSHGTLYYLIQVWVDDRERLTNWSQLADRPSFPSGTTVDSLRRDVVRLYVDPACWAPVGLADLRKGMTFERLVSRGGRVRRAHA